MANRSSTLRAGALAAALVGAAAACAPVAKTGGGTAAALGSSAASVSARAATPARALPARGRTLHTLAPIAPLVGTMRISGRCSVLTLGGRMMNGDCGDEMRLSADADGRITASFALMPAAGGGTVTLQGQHIGPIGPGADAFWIDALAFSGGAARLAGGPGRADAPVLGGCSYTDPAAERATVTCMAVDEDGLGIEVRFEGDRL